ncbi:acetoacetate--CoA ligase [Streptomyces javensis]|uniref:acetoacetate--CoA ligase n=1 Tax=Streptomyces javensis TaxID=114698 RepID=UPI0033FB5CCC
MTGGAAGATVLWRPSRAAVRDSALIRFARATGHGEDYHDLWTWSVTDLEGFWTAAAEFLGVRWRTRPRCALGSRAMPGTEWFPGGWLSFAEHVFADRDPGKVAVRYASEAYPGVRVWTWADLRRETARIRAGLRGAGVGRGDRVAAYLPNLPQTLAAFLATASLGAVWSAAAPEFGTDAVVDRFAQIEPTVLLAVDGYRHKGRTVDRDTEGRDIARRTGARYVRLGHLDGSGWENGFLGPEDSELAHEAVAFDHPLWVLYSSGTTGPPKAIVHGHGGVLLELLKTTVLQLGIGPLDRVFWHTTTGWVMWNILVGPLLADASVVLYDGHPGHEALWDLAEQTGMTVLGTSAAWLASCRRNDVRPLDGRDLSALRVIGSTGSPLAPECYDWVYATFPTKPWLVSLSGGTDVVTPFLGAVPTVPVYRGELGPPALGVDLRSCAPDGRPLVGAVGEMVVAQPVPSMPIGFWNDPTGERLRRAYFSGFPGVWTHGDWLLLTERHTGVISGRSDATINRGGVRMGTGEIYRALLTVPEVQDALAVDVPRPGTHGWLVLFTVLSAGSVLDDALRSRVTAAIRTGCSPRHVPDEIVPLDEIPRTTSGKKLEVPVKRILMGADPDSVVSRGSLANPASLDAFRRAAAHLIPTAREDTLPPGTRPAPAHPFPEKEKS